MQHLKKGDVSILRPSSKRNDLAFAAEGKRHGKLFWDRRRVKKGEGIRSP